MAAKNTLRTFVFLIIWFTVMLNDGCKKNDNAAPAMQTGTVTDVTGKTYSTVKIGNQWWMAEDLRTIKYRDSTSLFVVPPPPFDSTWQHYTTGAYCYNLNNQNAIVGTLYNWYAINDPRGLAPKGWHIPSDAEWQQLEECLGMSAEDANKTSWRGTHEGEKLKVTQGATGGWADYGSVWATDESGFNALAYGCRMFDGSWGDPGQGATGFWWTSTSQGNDAWYRYLDYKNANVFRYFGAQSYGFSVRCVKD